MALKETAREFLGSLGADFTSRLSLDWLRKKPEGQKQQKTRKAVEIILELYPRVPPTAVENERVNETEWLAGQGKGDPEHLMIIRDYPTHEERNRRIREDLAARDTQVNLTRRHDRLAWLDALSNSQAEQLEFLSDATLGQLFKEDNQAERDMILMAVVEKTVFENIQGTFRKFPNAVEKTKEFFRWAYGQLDARNRAAIDWYRNKVEHRRERRKVRGGRRLLYLIAAPGIFGLVMFIITLVRMAR